MARRKAPADQPDALVWAEESGGWGTFCALCPRNLPGLRPDPYVAWERARSHLELTHGLVRIWVKRDRPRHLELVQAAFDIAQPHHRTLSTDRRGQ